MGTRWIARFAAGLAVLTAPLASLAAPAGAIPDWPATFDVLLLMIVGGSIAYLLYDLRAARRARESRRARDELWNSRAGYQRRYPAGPRK